MSEENTLAVLPNEGNARIEHYANNAREITPGLELTLAKRILRPGTNRVVCLAARTSVPLNDDELASVSDVALKLSDGTNVRLSVSLFNDLGGVGSAPFRRYIYDPNRYANQSDLRGLKMLAAMLVIFTATYCSLTTESLRRLQWQQLLQASSNRSLAKVSSIYPRTTPAKAIEVKESAKSTIQVRKQNDKQILQSKVMMNKSLAKRINQTQPKIKSIGQTSILIPPPPPVPYTVPFNFVGSYDPAQLIKSAVSSSPGQKVLVNRAEPSSNQLNTSAEMAQKNIKTYLPAANRAEPPLERIAPLSPTNSYTAPVPGNSATVYPLERIILPAESGLH
jgi:hypothetical protein